MTAVVLGVASLVAVHFLNAFPPEPDPLYRNPSAGAAIVVDLGDATVIDDAKLQVGWAKPIDSPLPRELTDRSGPAGDLRGWLESTVHVPLTEQANVRLRVRTDLAKLIDTCAFLRDAQVDPSAGASWGFSNETFEARLAFTRTREFGDTWAALAIPAMPDRDGRPYGIAGIRCTFTRDALIADNGPTIKIVAPTLGIWTDDGTAPGAWCLGYVAPPLPSRAEPIDIPQYSDTEAFGCNVSSADYGVARAAFGGTTTRKNGSDSGDLLNGFVDTTYDRAAAESLQSRTLIAGVLLGVLASTAVLVGQWLEEVGRWRRRRDRAARAGP